MAVNEVSQVTIWGNHSSTQFPDVRHAKVSIGGAQKSVYEAVNDDAWLTGDFVSVSKKFNFFLFFLNWSWDLIFF